ncbi:MAG: hypothetical protein JNL10_19580, partial [Verrucomicrobiales bacterium]|nr:hypothetical protein [Verrucomicrobiales bacterium]
RLAPPTPTLDRWVYFLGDFAGDRPVAPTFASFDPRFDTRDGQFLMGWDTAGTPSTGAGPANYLLLKARVTLTIAVDKAFVYDPTFDAFQTYLTNEPAALPDTDPGRPIELYGAGFRNGFTADTFKEASPYGPVNPFTSDSITIATRNAFAAMHGTQGTLIDIANNVGQRNASWTNAPFEVRPWAVGVTADAAPGDVVPVNARFTFDVDLTDPLVAGYFQSALDQGVLRLFVSSLSPATQITPGGTGGGGFGAYPQWVTKENALFDPPDSPQLEIEGTVVGPADTDGDGLPDDWELFYFHNLDSGADGDADTDGASNLAEWKAHTNPVLASSLFQIVDAGFDPDGNARLRFSIAPSTRYRVEASDDLKVWHPVHGDLAYPQPGLAEFQEQKLNVPPAAPPAAFYRVVIDDATP